MKKEYDLKKLQKRKKPPVMDKSATKVPISLRIDGNVLGDIRTEAERQGIPYQTLIGSVLCRYIKGELIDKHSTEQVLKLVKMG